jgi:L-ascorbate metabolism protein UlaG (beta-lactamase superfamily)
MQFQFVRHATFILNLNGKNLLVDPMLSGTGAMDPISHTPNQKRNPLVELPWGVDDLTQHLEALDGVIVTHTHFDHWDERAVELLNKELPLFCQPEDVSKLISVGFENTQSVESTQEWDGIQITRTGGRHGTGELGQRMGPVSGFVLRAEGEPICYIAGDTIWCEEVVTILVRQKPDVVVVNAGAAQFNEGDPITMNSSDVINVRRTVPEARVIAVHMEAINHCLLTRDTLRADLLEENPDFIVDIPMDGDLIEV